MRVIPLAAVLFFLMGWSWAFAAESVDSAAEAPVAISHRVKGLDTRTGFLSFHLDHDAGKLWLETPAADPETQSAHSRQ